jgi:hypothetical protein
MRERITKAAVEYGDTVYSLDPPNRHHHVLWLIAERVPGAERPIRGVQGFVTSAGRFVGRVEAGQIALAAGQTAALRWGDELFSEDLW